MLEATDEAAEAEAIILDRISPSGGESLSRRDHYLNDKHV
jgi:hypothetical protein